MVVKWSVWSPSTLTIRVWTPLKSAVLLCKLFEKNKNKQKVGRDGKFKKLKNYNCEVVVAQLIERSLLTPEICSSNLTTTIFLYYQLYWISIEKTKFKKNQLISALMFLIERKLTPGRKKHKDRKPNKDIKLWII